MKPIKPILDEEVKHNYTLKNKWAEADVFVTGAGIQAWQTNGEISLHYTNESCDVTLTWNKDDLPHCLVWIANSGLRELPIGEGFIGIEPTSNFFDCNDNADAHINLHGLDSTLFGTKLKPMKFGKQNINYQ